ncbi:ribonuclease HII [Methanocalculus chunghsingensis]|uniref:Ribonuclease HII n=1 Tax=Methanocalculus chunghsingensis TaxID=156457 RepID=A0A8J7W907_9EURY|nr:ribonuclease HII [Methanocalculus chunghsingensis]MBR1369966.1 ribonuclease HII [Methanocalculus chunghsingensis]
MFSGVDEAGKGAVLGPMVIAGIGVSDLASLENLGIRDSKLLSPRRREMIFDLLTSSFSYHVVSLLPYDIDAALPSISINRLIAEANAACVTALSSEVAYLDACDVNAGRFGENVSYLIPFPCTVIAEHQADRSYPIVGAASIIAKVIRDRSIEALNEEYGEIGSGYPSDKTTIRFLTDYIRDNHIPPPCARRSWKTVSSLLLRQNQSSLSDF